MFDEDCFWDWDNEECTTTTTDAPSITYSDIEGGYEGEGNIDIYPQFTDPENGDYTLQEDSPCIDAGTADLDGDGYDDITDYYGQAPDMGAFEWYPEEPEYQLGDVNGDGAINVIDIVGLVNIILGSLEPSASQSCSADVSQDGIINVIDIVSIVSAILN